MKASKQKTVVKQRDLLASTPSAVHAAASRRGSAGIMGPQGQSRRRARRRLDRQQEREARLSAEIE